MKKYFVFLILLISSLSSYSFEKKDSCNACIFMDIDYEGSISIYDLPKGKVLKRLKHNIEDGDYVIFAIKQRTDSMFYITACYSMNEDSIIAKGWINKTDKLGIFTRAYDQPLILYKMPSTKEGEIYRFKEYDPKMMIVLDCKNGWLKIRVDDKSQSYIGWIPPEMQCCNVYSTCS